MMNQDARSMGNNPEQMNSTILQPIRLVVTVAPITQLPLL
jgi:hypothetical protein